MFSRLPYFIFLVLITALTVVNCSTPTTPTYQLTTTVVGSGTITPSDGEFEAGESVTLTAIPESGWVFSNWEGDWVSFQTTSTIIMDDDKSIIGVFSRKSYPLNITIEGEGTVTEKIISQPKVTDYPYETVVELAPVAAEGWVFVEWTGDVVSKESVIEVAITDETNITATFQRKNYPLSIAIKGEGTVSERIVSQPKVTDYPFETIVELTPNPSEGWKFVEWTGDVVSQDTVIQLTIVDATSVTATFQRIEYPLNITIEGEGTVTEKIISQPKVTDYLFETIVELTPNPSEGWKFVEWTGDVISQDTVLQLTITDSTEIIANFEIFRPKLDLYIEGEGRLFITHDDTVEVISDSSSMKMKTLLFSKDFKYGTNIDLRVYANDYYEYENMTYEGNLVFDDSLIFVMDRDVEVVAYFNPVSYDAILENLYRNFYNYLHSYSGIGLATSVLADATTASWGNSKMREAGTEPRIELELNGSYEYVLSNLFNNLHETYRYSETILDMVDSGYNFELGRSNAKIIALFTKFLSTGYISLVYDQGLLDQNDSGIINSNVRLVDSEEMHLLTHQYFDELMNVIEQSNFSVPESIIGTPGGLDKSLFKELVNTYMARFIVNYPRNQNESNNIDWTQVKQLTSEGINSDFTVNHSAWESLDWYKEDLIYSTYPGWARADMRVINMMDDSYPSHNANGNEYPAPDSIRVFDNAEVDNRLWTDFSYLSNNNFRPERGLYFFSSFRYTRHVDYIGPWSKEIPEILVWENMLYLAESYLMTGDYFQAATILNNPNSPRKLRGGLLDVNQTHNEIKDAIHHERIVELFLSSTGLSWFEMRRNDLLQEGSFLELPLPYNVQKDLGLPTYTTGGVGGNSSAQTCGWRC